jgi:hypothetical protein
MPKFMLSSKERFMILSRMRAFLCASTDEQTRYDKLWDAAEIEPIDDIMQASPNRGFSENDFDDEPKEYDLPFSILRAIKELFTPSANRPIPYGVTRLMKPLLKRIEESPDLTTAK